MARIMRMEWPLDTALISKSHKLLYMPIAKNACTSLKRLMISLSDSPMREVALATPHFHALLAEQDTGISLKDVSYDEAEAILCDRQWLKFIVLRNPYERLASGYVQKFVDVPSRDGVLPPEAIPVIEWVYAQRGQSADLQRGISFAEFVDYLVSFPGDYDVDSHWRPQTAYFRGASYDFIGRVEDMGALQVRLSDRVGCALEIEERNAVPRASIPQRSGMAHLLPADLFSARPYPSAHELMASSLGEAVRQRYKDDFELYEGRFGPVSLYPLPQ